MMKQPFTLPTLIRWTKHHVELLFWCAAMLLLFFLNTDDLQPSLCVFRWIGIEYCPGCGLGHSIHHALHARFAQSIAEHLMGLPALFIICHRITQLIYPKKTPIYEK